MPLESQPKLSVFSSPSCHFLQAVSDIEQAIFGGVFVGIFNLTIFASLHRLLPQVFTQDAEVVEIASTVIYVCAVMQIFDALAAVSHGILRGVGRQAIGGYANLFSYYCVALPVSLSTAFALHWKLAGLWAGLTAGLMVYVQTRVANIGCIVLTHLVASRHSNCCICTMRTGRLL